MGPLEIEVKFFLHNRSRLRDKLLALGAVSQGEHFELNLRFDDDHGSLFHSGALLRLRQAEKTTLTYKALPPEADTEFKVLREIEVVVDDFTAMGQILGAMGWHSRQCYEKRRETFSFNETVLCLDDMPFGSFLEIEGDRERIRSAAVQIGFDWSQRILKNYLEIFEILKEEMGWTFSDLTFENFRPIEFDPASLMHRIENRLFSGPPPKNG